MSKIDMSNLLYDLFLEESISMNLINNMWLHIYANIVVN